jgi:hypothetical protein
MVNIYKKRSKCMTIVGQMYIFVHAKADKKRKFLRASQTKQPLEIMESSQRVKDIIQYIRSKNFNLVVNDNPDETDIARIKKHIRLKNAFDVFQKQIVND